MAAIDRRIDKFIYTAPINSIVTKHFSHQIDKISDCLKESNDSPNHCSPGGKSFHSQGPVAEKLLS